MSTQFDLGGNAVRPAPSGWWGKLQGKEFGVAWSLAAVAGAIAISLSPTYELKRLFLPLVIMVVYACYGYQLTGRLRNMPALRAARITLLADSLYFLGFLWTLYALIDTFVFKQMSAAESVFRVFGYALVTTATGMFFRLFLLQFQYTVQDQRELGELTIEQKLGEFTKKISDAGTAIDDFRARTDKAAASFQANTDIAVATWTKSLTHAIQSLDGNVTTIDAKSREIKDALSKIHETSALELRASVQEAVKTFVDGLQPPLRELNEANVEFVTKVRAATDQVSTTVAQGRENIDKSMSAFRAGIQAGSLDVEKSLTDVGERIRSVSLPEDKEIKDAFRKIHETSALELRTSIEKAVKTFIEGLQPALRKLNEANIELATNVKAGTDQVSRTLAQGRENIETSLIQFGARALAGLSDVEKSLTDLGERIRRIRVPEDIVASEVRTHVSQATAGFRELDKALRESATSVRNLSYELRQRPAAPKGFWGRLKDNLFS